MTGQDGDSGPTSPGSEADPVEAARKAIQRLFDEGYIDENHATTALLAIDLGKRKAHRLKTAELHRWPA